MELNSDITRKILNALFDGILTENTVYLLLICKSWQRYIYKHTSTFYLYDIGYVDICRLMPKLVHLVISDECINNNTSGTLERFITRHPKFCSKITTLDTCYMNKCMKKFSNLKKLILRYSDSLSSFDIYSDICVDILVIYVEPEYDPIGCDIDAKIQIYHLNAEPHVGLKLRYAIFHDKGSIGDYEAFIRNLEYGSIEDIADLPPGSIISIVNYTSCYTITYMHKSNSLTNKERNIMSIAKTNGIKLELVRAPLGIKFEGTDRDIVRKY